MAIAGAVFTLVLFFAGFHDSAEKMTAAQWIGIIGGVGIGATCLALAMREKRTQFPAEAEWGYGSALGVGVLSGLFASLFGLVTAYLYFVILNPGFSEVVFQAQLAAMEEKGVPAAQLEKMEPMLRMMSRPGTMVISQCIGGFISSVVLSLIIAIFFRKRPIVPSVIEVPPLVG